ncbi:MAG: tRNA (adenosine(37)-N6)-dimethylallyltransferase MiaA [Bacteroidetes bacterium]|nr:tRNA (adenosine(37)-N6)-dimethylallyltransferase MiaA [Bacteroidota bacterium]
MYIAQDKILLVIIGPTAVGKTEFCVNLAQKLNTEIISADSRQVYKEISIGTAKPNKEETYKIKHHLIDFLNLNENYSVGDFINDAQNKINKLFESKDYVIMTGGAGLYIDAFCNGLDDMPNIDLNIRKELNEDYKKYGLEPLINELEDADFEYYQQADLNNPRRVIRALEIYRSTKKPYSTFRIEAFNKSNDKNFKILKIGLNRDREELYNRINQRVDNMFEEGLLEEAKKVYKYKKYNSLQTVGYKEIFDFLDNKITLNEAIELIKRNTRRYAKRQMTWFLKDESIKWLNPDKADNMFNYFQSFINKNNNLFIE